MSALPATAAATEALTIGRAALRQLHDTLSRDVPDLTVPILQEVGFAAGGGVFQAFCTWLPAETGVARPDDLDAGRLRSEEHTSELQSHSDLVCRLLLEKKKKKKQQA